MNIRNLIVAGIIMTVSSATLSADEPVAYVNPFIGTTNFGTTNPGAICPNGLMSVTPFNVMGSNKTYMTKMRAGGPPPTNTTTHFLPDFLM